MKKYFIATKVNPNLVLCYYFGNKGKKRTVIKPVKETGKKFTQIFVEDKITAELIRDMERNPVLIVYEIEEGYVLKRSEEVSLCEAPPHEIKDLYKNAIIEKLNEEPTDESLADATDLFNKYLYTFCVRAYINACIMRQEKQFGKFQIFKK